MVGKSSSVSCCHGCFVDGKELPVIVASVLASEQLHNGGLLTSVGKGSSLSNLANAFSSKIIRVNSSNP